MGWNIRFSIFCRRDRYMKFLGGFRADARLIVPNERQLGVRNAFVWERCLGDFGEIDHAFWLSAY